MKWYTAVDQPAMYDNISIPLFIGGYMLVTKAEKPTIRRFMTHHLVERMGDAELYG